MTEVIRHKTLSSEFSRLQMNENDLFRVATIVENLALSYGGQPNIEVVSGDGEETLRTKSSEFFLNDQLPQNIRSIMIGFSKYNAPISCMINLTAMQNRSAYIKVDGTDTSAVAAVFHELKRELTARETGGPKFIILSEKHLVSTLFLDIIYSILAAASIYSLFDIPLNIIYKYDPDFKNSMLCRSIIYIGWLCVVMGFFGGGLTLSSYIKKSFPPVEFAGRISDPSKHQRKYLLLFISFILIPIVVNVVSALIMNAMNR